MKCKTNKQMSGIVWNFIFICTSLITTISFVSEVYFIWDLGLFCVILKTGLKNYISYISNYLLNQSEYVELCFMIDKKKYIDLEMLLDY